MTVISGAVCYLCRCRNFINACSQARFLTRHGKNGSAVELAYVSFKQTNKETCTRPPLIIMHGMMGSRSNWQSLSKVLSRTGRKVFSVDARNHGESPHTENMDFYSMRDDVLYLMDENQYERATLVGHSMGGKTFMTTALTQPDRVAGLVVVDVSPTVSPMAQTYPRYLEMMLRISGELQETKPNISLSQARRFASQRLQEVEPDPYVCQFLATNLIQPSATRFKWRVNVDAIINNFPTLSSFPEFQNETYDGPTLFMAGQKSPYIKEENVPSIKTLFPNAIVEYIEGAGHWVHADKPRVFVEKLNSFLDASGL